jgi:lipoprotein-anchoring transpeptidase ErfK/SrfK
MLRPMIAAVVIGPLLLAGLGIANVARFNARADALERSWSAAESLGVTPAQLAPARASLRSIRDRHILFLPYSIFSDALLADPFGQPESLAASGQADALATTRARAQDDLAKLKQLGVVDYDIRAAALDGAHQLADYVRLARAFENEAAAAGQLTQAAGGLTNGLPKDVVDGVARLQDLIASAGSVQVPADPAPRALTDAQTYLTEPYTQLVAQHEAIASEVRTAGDAVQHRVDTRALANQLLNRLPNLLSQATRYSLAASYSANASQARAGVVSAESSGDDATMDSATNALKQAVDALGSAVGSAETAAADGTSCIDGAPAQLIVIHTSTQRLIAYDHGCPILNTLVTTGRPGLRTDTGTFTIHAKYPSYLMRSPWPKPDPRWYPDTTVHDAMLFNPADGTFIHSAEWEPASQYGPGSENGPGGSHGCVHVMNVPLATLFDWAQVGATVVVPDEAQG